MFSRTLTLLLLATFLTLVITVTSVAGLSADAKRTGQNIAVCTIPKCIPSPKQVSNLARGITFETCVDPALKSDPAFSLVHVSIQPDSGFKQQLWDAGDSLDTYWLKQYLAPLTTCDKKFAVDCWEAPDKGCAKPPAPAPAPAAKAKRGNEKPEAPKPEPAPPAHAPPPPQKDSRADADLMPLQDPSIAKH